jgi:hypothetical protein
MVFFGVGVGVGDGKWFSSGSGSGSGLDTFGARPELLISLFKYDCFYFIFLNKKLLNNKHNLFQPIGITKYKNICFGSQ